MATVTISQGRLRGGLSVTESGFEYYEFLGIPYAKPPVGNLRFQSPQSPEPWEDVRDATKCNESKISCQMDMMLTNQPTGSEDCLYLNVYTPQLRSSATSPLPVIVYIHGGGFVYGSGTLKNFTGPDYLVERNTVVVSINYRLGVLGFLSLDIPEVAGNMGLKDQVKALEWVKNNISEFGGDNYNVTIMGLSAGSASVEYLILSPLTRGLFHKGILQSGSALNPWAINLNPMDFTRQFLQLLDYKGSEDSKAIYEFLLGLPAEELIKAAFTAAEKYSPENLFFGFVPTIEKDFGNGEAFLANNPYKLLKEGKFHKVPVIRGFCNKEGGLISVLKPAALSGFMAKMNFANLWTNEIDPNEKETVNSKFTLAYLGKVSDEGVADLVEDFFGDLAFAAGVWIASKLSSRKTSVFVYQFCYDGNINYLKKLLNIQKKGALHGDDCTYVIKISNPALGNPDEVDISVRNRLVKMFTDFAKTGEPVPVASANVKKIVKMFAKFAVSGEPVSGDEVISNSWEPFTETSPVFLNIDKEFSTLENYEPEKIAIFEYLYENFFA